MMDKLAALYDSGEPSAKDTNDALWNACHGGQFAAAKFLHGKGGDVNAVPQWQPMTPLDAANRRDVPELFEWLLANGAKEYKNL